MKREASMARTTHDKSDRQSHDPATIYDDAETIGETDGQPVWLCAGCESDPVRDLLSLIHEAVISDRIQDPDIIAAARAVAQEIGDTGRVADLDDALAAHQ